MRCPHCGKPVSAKEMRAPGEQKRSCPWCAREFPAPLWPEPSLLERPLISGNGVRELVLVLLIAFIALLSYVAFASDLKGPEFLGYYFVLLVALLLSKSIFEDDLSRFAPFVLFETVGLWRYVEGSLHGMHRFGYLFGLMLVGGFLFFLSASSFSGSGRGASRTSRCSSSSSSSCSSWSFLSSSSSSSSSSCSGGSSSGCSSGGGGCGGGGGGCGGCGG
jgi:hypothetical protein